jgi:thiol-disulfide isomerase/thioredoxin
MGYPALGRSRCWGVWPLATVLSAAVLCASCGKPGTARTAAGAGTARVPAASNAPAARDSAAGPPVLAIHAAGLLARIEQSGARATLVNVWATWCAPCREEFPALLRAARRRAPRGLRLLLVSADFEDQLPAVREFLRAQGVTDTTYIETGDPMVFINAMNPAWSGALPATLVYDAEGRRTAFWEGAADSTRFSVAADRAMSPNPPTKEASP